MKIRGCTTPGSTQTSYLGSPTLPTGGKTLALSPVFSDGLH
jgi:hypothetical protein